MRNLKLVNHLSDVELKEKLSVSSGKPEFSRWQILYLIQVAKIQSADTIAPLVNLSKPSIYKIVEGYNKSGVQGIRYSPRGGRHRFLLSTAQEAEVLQAIEQKAAKGLIKTANDIRSMVEHKVGRKVSDDYLWDLLKRNGWKKKMPRPHHPQRTLAEQQEFKKNSPTVWLPCVGQPLKQPRSNR
ncbi:MAG: winged helix-turn-helix domain-containing protein [Chitinophagaceae bacterium]|nr:winged helix-turn-helix domain-containing protein [Chitinophagaceae bacterium]MCW5929560.1 winged helix-turn-helix domain-containing protein [Chitinophagaceae bacterium]